MRLSGAGSGGCTWRCRDGERDDECSGLERGLCNVRAAFVADAAPESAGPGWTGYRPAGIMAPDSKVTRPCVALSKSSAASTISGAGLRRGQMPL